jgi:lipopolysaccharide/colanic/teichoic acid biosynthesis glycosyltransferase
MRNLTQRAWEVSEFTRDYQIPFVVEDAAMERIGQRERGYLIADDILPKHRFVKQVQLEKRRTDRSKVPLSIALFRFDGKRSRQLSDVNELLQFLLRSKRETDTLGYMGDDLVALLLPDTSEPGTRGFRQKVVDRADALGFSIVVGTYPDQLFDNLTTTSENPSPHQDLFLDGATDRVGVGYLLKRALDIVGSVAGILLFSPLMLIIALAIALTSPGPIIFRQVRLGRRGVPFVFYKFRSMAQDADDRIHRHYVTRLISGDVEGANQGDVVTPLFKIRSDPRVTRIGKIIRKTSIDELPQLFNVLKGDMSLVGPRPPLRYEAENYQSWHLRRVLEMKPGMTGLWQVEGRSKTSFDDMVRMDLRYVRRCSLMFDLKILVKTVKVVLMCEGAK